MWEQEITRKSGSSFFHQGYTKCSKYFILNKLKRDNVLNVNLDLDLIRV